MLYIKLYAPNVFQNLPFILFFIENFQFSNCYMIINIRYYMLLKWHVLIMNFQPSISDMPSYPVVFEVLNL